MGIQQSRRTFIKKLSDRKPGAKYSHAEVSRLIFLAELGMEKESDRKFQRMAIKFLSRKP